jgi:hypothetical protein
VARAAERLREHRPELNAVHVLPRLLVDRTVRLDGAPEMDAAAVEDREARLARVGGAVVADERRPAAHLTRLRVREVRGDDVLPLREVVDRAEVGVVLLDVRERGKDHEAEDGERDDGPDRRAEPERRRLEEPRPRIARKRLVGDGDGRRDRRHVRNGARLGRDVRYLLAHAARDVSRPQDPEDDGEDGADRRHDPADDEAEQEARNPDREADGPEARARCVRGVVARVAQLAPCLDSTDRRSTMSTT